MAKVTFIEELRKGIKFSRTRFVGDKEFKERLEVSDIWICRPIQNRPDEADTIVKFRRIVESRTDCWAGDIVLSYPNAVEMLETSDWEIA